MRWPCHAAGVGTTIIVSAGPTPSLEAAERQRELEERTTKMLEEERARNDMQARAMYELLVVSFFCRLPASLNI